MNITDSVLFQIRMISPNLSSLSSERDTETFNSNVMIMIQL